MKAVFVELPPFERQRNNYLDDDEFKSLQFFLLRNPEAGAVIEGTGGLRIIYYWWNERSQFWLFACYNKDEMDDLSAPEKKLLKAMLKAELEARQ